MLRTLIAMLSLLCATAAAVNVHAQNVPPGPMRIVVPFQAGGLTDILARTLATPMSESLGVPVVVENRPGASGNLGAEVIAQAPPTGQHLLMGAIGPNAVNQFLFGKMPYDTMKAFAPITLAGYGTLLLVVHPSVPASNLKELLAYAKANPGKLTYASGGSGGSQHLAGELLKNMTGVDITHVPYKGITQGVTDLVGGQISMTFDLATVLPHMKAGRLRPIAVANRERASALPEIPTIAEAGVPGYEASAWYGLFAPAGTPPAIVARLNAEAVKALKRPDIREKLLVLGAEPGGNSPAEFSAYITAEAAKWSKLVRDAKIKMD